jgi:signal transduction histidine kinase
MVPEPCAKCAVRSCERSNVGDLGICEYGISYYREQESIVRAEATIPLRHIAANLRHEITPILMLIVEEANKINPSLSARSSHLEDPASRIFAGALILDRFVEMLTGVNEFTPEGTLDTPVRKDRWVHEAIRRSHAVYALIRNSHRAKDLGLKLHFLPLFVIESSPDIVEYLFSILIDNAWKYSQSGTDLDVYAEEHGDGRISVAFVNIGRPIPAELDIFSLGSKADTRSKGFGYGLFWASILIKHYNLMRAHLPHPLGLTHSQEVLDSQTSRQTFTITNLAARTAR